MPRNRITNEQMMKKLDEVLESVRASQVIHYVSYPIYPPSQPQSWFTVTTATPPNPIASLGEALEVTTS